MRTGNRGGRWADFGPDSAPDSDESTRDRRRVRDGSIPLETFVHSLRTVLGLFAIGFLRFVSLALRVLGNAFRYLGLLAEHLYDLPLFIPIWLEQRNSNDTDNSSLHEVTP